MSPSTKPSTNALLFQKTRLCRFHAKGKCSRGDDCVFAHGNQNLQPSPNFYKTRFCVGFLQAGACRADKDCKFAHGIEDLHSPLTPSLITNIVKAECDRIGESGAESHLRPGPDVMWPGEIQHPRETWEQGGHMLDRCKSLSFQIAAVQQQMQGLQAQLLAFQAPPCASPDYSSSAETSADTCAICTPAPQSFSRQTTAEPDPADHSGLASDLDSEEYEAHYHFEVGSEQEAALQPLRRVVGVPPEPLTLRVKSTFLHVDCALSTAPARRARSAGPR